MAASLTGGRVLPPALSSTRAHGAHVLLDFVDFLEPDVTPAASGEWMLQTLRTAVAEHGVREVHSKLVVLGEHGESPPGFTAVALLDESHVTAHCYSDRGLLAVDIFYFWLVCGALLNPLYDAGILLLPDEWLPCEIRAGASLPSNPSWPYQARPRDPLSASPSR